MALDNFQAARFRNSRLHAQQRYNNITMTGARQAAAAAVARSRSDAADGSLGSQREGGREGERERERVRTGIT